METHRRTFFTERGIAIVQRGAEAARDGQDRAEPDHLHRDLIAGELHYWRLDPRDWRACLQAMKSWGIGIVSTYVPWGEHEIRPGRFDWNGEYDLARFLDQVAAEGMHALIRPGPHINAELTFFGFPERLLRRQEIQAITARDTPAWLPAPTRAFPVPSYAARALQEEVRAWYAAVGAIVAPRRAPDGPVIAVQVDNEAQMFFRLGAYDLDYHPDALAWWRESSGHEEPPRRWSADDAERCVQWVRFKDEYTARALSWMSRALDDSGFDGLARYHNLPPSDPALVDIPRIQDAIDGPAGMDFYLRSQDYETCRRRALYLAGSAHPLPFAPEVGVGAPFWLPALTATDAQNTLLGLLAAGVRAFNLYMLIDRERWYGAAFDGMGEMRAESQWLRALLASLTDIEWTSLRRHAPVALVWSRADDGFARASSVADPITPVLTGLLQLGPAGAAELALAPGAADHRRWLDACERALDMAQIPYDIVDEGCSAEKLSQYRAVIVPTLERVDRGLWQRLHQLSQASDTVIVLGPGKPSRDQSGVALGEDATLPTRAGLIRPQSIDDISGFADDLAAIAGELPQEWSAEEGDVDCSLFVDDADRPTAFFVGNRAADALVAKLLVPGRTAFIDAVTETALTAGEDGLLEVPLAGHQVRMLLVD